MCYANREGLKLLRRTYGYITDSTKVPVFIFEGGCQIQLSPHKIKIVDIMRPSRHDKKPYGNR